MNEKEEPMNEHEISQKEVINIVKKPKVPMVLPIKFKTDAKGSQDSFGSYC